jgi:lysophospholipase L1-like esterase
MSEVIVCFGDSLTEGDGDDNPGAFDRSKSYPAFLQAKVGAAVVNAGRCGDTAQSGRERLERDALSKKPDIVVVEFGANDFFCGRRVPDVKADLRSIIGGVRRCGGKVFLASFAGDDATRAAFKANIGTGDSGFDARLAEYAQMFAELLAENPDVSPVPNFWNDVYTDPSRMSRDRVHPLTEGYRKIADNVFKALAEFFIPD